MSKEEGSGIFPGRDADLLSLLADKELLLQIKSGLEHDTPTDQRIATVNQDLKEIEAAITEEIERAGTNKPN